MGVGSDHAIYRTTDGGTTWVTETLTPSPQQAFLKVFMLDAERAVAVGQGDMIYRRQ